MTFLVATTSLPAVDRPNADRPNAARSRQNKGSESDVAGRQAMHFMKDMQGLQYQSYGSIVETEAYCSLTAQTMP